MLSAPDALLTVPWVMAAQALSGWVFQAYGLQACLWVSSIFVLLAALISIGLPRHAVVQT